MNVSIKKLTPKQQIFVKEYLIDFNATRAAKAAGYSEKTAKQMGTENLAKPAIQQAIQKHTKKLTKKAELTVDKVLAGIQEMLDMAKEDKNYAGMGKALEMQAKYLKMLTDRIEHSGSISKVEDMTDEQLDAAIAAEREKEEKAVTQNVH